MEYDRIIAVSNNVAIYRHGDKRIKVFICENQFLNALEECAKTQRIKELTKINVPQIYSVNLKNNRVEIFSDLTGEGFVSALLEYASLYGKGGRENA